MLRTIRPNTRVLRAVLALAASTQFACSSDPVVSTPTQAEDLTGSVEGALSVVSVNSSENERSMVYMLLVDGRTQPVPLIFAEDPNLPSQTRLRVWGVDEAGMLHVTRHELVTREGEPARQAAALIGAPSKTRTVAWVQMDVNNGGVTQTKEEANRLIFDTTAAGPRFGTKSGDKSVVQYYDEVSYGTMKLTGQVEGPIPFSGTACNNFDPLARDVVAKVTALGRTYDHYYLYWGSRQNCGPGWGAQGTQTRPGKYVWLNQDGTFCTATGQEIGHNFGMMHASTLRCSGATMANSTSSCTGDEYGNPMTVMGGGCRHLIAPEKWYSGYFGGCNAVRVKTSATFTLFALETACNGIQALQIPFPSGAPTRTTSTSQSNGNVTLKNYYLELRGGKGMDTGLKTGVYVHVAPDIPTASQNGPRTFLLDMQPSNNSWDPMTVGQTYTDPAGGVSFKVDSADTTKATITVTIEGGSGANTCLDGSTVSGTGPDSCGETGGGTGGAGGGGTGGSSGGSVGSGGKSGGGGGTAGSGGKSGGNGGSSGSAGANSGGKSGGGGGASGGGGKSGGSGGSAGAGGLAGGAAGSTAQGGATASGGALSGGAPATSGGAPMTSGGAPATSGGAPATSGGAPTTSGGAPTTSGGANTGNTAGVPDPGSGCGCKVADTQRDRSPFAATFAALIAGMAFLRRRKKARPELTRRSGD